MKTDPIKESIFSSSETADMRKKEEKFVKQARAGYPADLVRYWANKHAQLVERTAGVRIPKIGVES